MSDSNPSVVQDDPAVVLLALATSRYSAGLVHRTIDEALLLATAGRPVRIDVLYVDEDAGLRRAGATLKDDGFLGLDPQESILEALAESHRRLARDRINEVKELAAPHGIPVQVEELFGEFSPLLEARAASGDYDVILLTRVQRPFIARLLLGSEADEIARLGREQGDAKVVITEPD
jgi:nucleotide-binding universal stress UspA family protein